MKYLCLICAEKVMEQMSETDAEQHYEEYAQFTRSIRESGKITTTDGPFAETKEQIGGYYVIEARDLNEAIQVASRIPGARLGCVEIRPVAEDERTLQALGFAD